MSFDPRSIANPEYFAENRRAPHSDHRWFADAAEAAVGESGFEQSLNGLWKFHYAKNLGSTIPGFEAPDYDTEAWDDIPVPAHIQLQGYDRPQYVNVQYPWDGLEDIAPGQIPEKYNPVGSYVRLFTLDRPLADGERLSVSFKGAETAVAVWLNGAYVGYACDSFTPSEFDLTPHLIDGENKLAAQVFKFSAASWIEDQDFFRFSGLFRDVVLYRRPAVHVEDLRVVTDLADDFGSAVLRVGVLVDGEGSVRATLAGVGELSPGPDGRLELAVDAPRLWSAEDPALYDLTVELFDAAGALVEVIPQRVGFRRFAIEDGLMKINGKRVHFVGVNRHEFGLQGRVMSVAQTHADLRQLKAANVNAIRTSHYPNNSFFYALADEYGFYVIDEMNLESHGHWAAAQSGRIAPEDVVPGSHPEWRGALLDRAANMLQRDKNHPSIVMWSCGNESFGGSNIHDVSDYFREQDTRPVHYEGASWDKRFPETTDVYSEMYTPAADVERFLAENLDKPYMLCEYAHAMGNSFGAVDAYLDLARREPRFQGGFIWDFADQAIRTTDPHGAPFFGYGGDFGDAPHDYEFSANGIFFADHTPKPFLQAVKYLYQALQVEVDGEGFTVTNHHLFTDAAAYRAVVLVRREGTLLAEADVDVAVAPGDTRRFPLPVTVPSTPGEYTVDVSFRLRAQTIWAEAGHEVAYGQGVVRVARAPRPAAPRPEVIDGVHNVGVRGRHFTALFARPVGGLVSYTYGSTSDGGRQLLHGVPKPNFWHAPTDNERGWGSSFEDGAWLLASRYAKAVAGPVVEWVGDKVSVSFTYALPTTPAGTCDVAYLVDGDGRIEVTMTVKPGEGLADMPEFGMLLRTDPAFDTVTWYGEGPNECYADRRAGARLDVYSGAVRDQLAPYVRPQESGSHTGVRWATVTDHRGAGLRFEADGEMEFSALPWTPFEIENAAHPVDLPPVQHTVLRPALARRGVAGDNSWGARTHPEYLLPRGELVFRFAFQGIR
ncbi:MAG: glycoside hydrolase family 2 TIM barrel-domain containing protein [Arachnia sp.]